MSCLTVDYKLGLNVVMGTMGNGASVNRSALRQLMFFFPKLFDVACFSHTIDNVSSHFQFRLLDLFARYWIGMFSHSYNARLVWKERTGQSIRTINETRWWSKWKVLNQVVNFFGLLSHFCVKMTKSVLLIADICWKSSIVRKRDLPDLRLELAALIDGGCILSMPYISWKAVGHLYLPAMKGFLRFPRL